MRLALDAIDRSITWVVMVTSITTLVTLFLVLFANTVMRYFGLGGITWAGDLARLGFPWMVMASAVLTAQAGRHIAVEVFVLVLPAWLRRWLLVIVQLLLAVGMALLAQESLAVVDATWRQMLPVIGIPRAYAYMSMPVGLALLGVTAVTTAIRIAVSPSADLNVRSGAGDDT